MEAIVTSPIFQYSSLALTLAVLILFFRYIGENDKQKAAAQERAESRYDRIIEKITQVVESSVTASVQSTETLKRLADQINQHNNTCVTNHMECEKSREKLAETQVELMRTFSGLMMELKKDRK